MNNLLLKLALVNNLLLKLSQKLYYTYFNSHHIIPRIIIGNLNTFLVSKFFTSLCLAFNQRTMFIIYEFMISESVELRRPLRDELSQVLGDGDRHVHLPHSKQVTVGQGGRQENAPGRVLERPLKMTVRY